MSIVTVAGLFKKPVYTHQAATMNKITQQVYEHWGDAIIASEQQDCEKSLNSYGKLIEALKNNDCDFNLDKNFKAILEGLEWIENQDTRYESRANDLINCLIDMRQLKLQQESGLHLVLRLRSN